ncbi:hypothetical protein D6851_03080 [Altericroceibacterium spongiae]|uniref:Uncharacterized protein n=1 Tax=Altericroceibacterium spongiae TaxID=2320269 RepID=A0A420ES13_9SPHN|nr:hypothetical protein D6851_03080 [Altericroceibacterium spongiae]
MMIGRDDTIPIGMMTAMSVITIEIMIVTSVGSFVTVTNTGRTRMNTIGVTGVIVDMIAMIDTIMTGEVLTERNRL